MKTDKRIGYLLIVGAIGVFVPYFILTITFNYPDILRQESGFILTEFHKGGSALIFTWLAFALFGLPLLVAYSLIGQKLESKVPNLRWITTIGIISGVVQIIGLLRWVFVVPVLATDFVNTTNPSAQEAIKISFKVIHQFGGVLLGEHLGQLFTVIWTVFISSALLKIKLIPEWLAWMGFISSFIYLLAQAELLATVIAGFPMIDVAGLLGSTLWLIWLILVGVNFIKN
ncbi:DUF4386 domain-containing protein [Adhaeribacter rhizoryzae]|uniref:DUF4386 domain-containing protein n=1 Tax=Adhaeribacter rhizoryzae TaxID=2607907 RepID=A0A5M6DQ66_9BACT|nr:DUF4386 domain-containing protein [Adhaeribacter rhizoryzae]KAA5548369.1 DUF4386 domain-containing protein [Adhaeribacter rhizoryzae]